MNRFQAMVKRSPEVQVCGEDGWEPPEGTVPFIVCAANQYGRIVVLGVRHLHTTMRNHIRLFSDEALVEMGKHQEEQGFVDQFGRFFNREDALKIVLASGQRFNAERNGSTTELFSEGLY